MLQKKSKFRAAIITSLCSFLYVPLMIGVLSNSKPSVVSAIAGETTVWTGDESEIFIDATNLPEENPEYLHFTFVKDDGAVIYDKNFDNELKVLTSADHGIVSFTDLEWSSMLASGGFWIWSDAEHITEISYKVKESAVNYDLWIAGIQVTSENKDDILPSASPGSGTASFDPATNTLSLNDFYIISQDSAPTDDFGYGDYKLNEIGIASKLDDLTIDVTNTVQIGKQLQPGHLDEYEFMAGIISTGDLTIVGSGKFFAFGDMGSAIADNLTIDMDFGGDDDDSQLFMESNARLPEGNYKDDVGTVLVNNDFNLLGGCVDINCFEENGVVSLGGDITIKDCQLEMETGHDCLFTRDGDLLIDNSYVGLQADVAGTEIINGVNEEKGNALIQNNSFVYVISNENIAMGLMSNNTFTVDDSRIYVVGSEADNLMSAIAAQEFEMTGNSLIYSNIGAATVSYEGPAKINITGGTVITNTVNGLFGGGESDGLFVVGSQATPFAVKNGAMYDYENDEFIPVDVCEGVLPTFDLGYGYMSNIIPADSEENDGFVEVNTYATVSMTDYEYGGTVSTPSIDHEIAKLWGIEMEEVMYLYYADGETIDDAEIWDEIEPDTLEVGTYNMVAYIVDHAMPMFQYYSDPVEFEVTTSGPTLVAKPTKDETTFTYTGEEQTYTLDENDLYTISDNVQTDAGEYTVIVSLKDKTNYSWADGSTDDLEYSFVIEKEKVAKPTADDTEFVYTGEEQTYTLDENDLYTISDNVQTDAGDYTVIVSLKDKTNYSWADGSTDDLEYDFTIAKAQQVIEISDLGKIYDANAFYFGEKDEYRKDNYFTKLGDGEVTIEYKVAGEEDSTYTTEVPVNAGNYVLKVSVTEGTNYLSGSATKNFTIDYAKISKVGFGDVSQPVAGEIAPTAAKGIAIGSRYSGSITWDKELVDGKFDYNTVYTATVTLDIVPSSANNYRFADNVTLVKPTEGWTKSADSTATKLVYTKTFEKTGKIPQVVSITNDISKTYDSTAVSAPTYTRLGDGAVTFEYKVKGADDSTYSTVAPTNAGNYVVKVNVAETDTYLSGYATEEFTIAKAEQIIQIGDMNKTFDNGLVYPNYTRLGDGDLTFEYKLVTEDDSKYSKDAPKDAGNYTIRVSVAEGTNYLSGSVTKDFTIDYAKISKVGFGDVSQPVAGEIAPTAAKGIAIGSRYSGSISWDKELVDGKFDYNTVYTATVTLDIVPSSANNYRFADNVTLVKPTEGWTKSADSTATKLIYTKTFEKTGKIPQVVAITNDISKTYDGTAISAPTYTRLGDGQVTIEYKVAGQQDSTYTSIAPTEVGNYVVKVTVGGTETHLGGSVTKEFAISKAKVAKPAADTSTFVYNGENQTYNIAQSDLYTITNNVQKDVGTYSVSVSLKDKTNYEWADGSTDDLTFEYTIAKAKVVKPTEDTSVFTYNGNEQTYNVSLNDKYTVTGNKATEPGKQAVVVSLKDKANYEWSDGTVEDLSFDFEINKIKVVKPTADNSTFIYNGEDQTYTIAGSDLYTISNNVQKNAGTHSVTVALKDKIHTCWADGSDSDIAFTFAIAKAKVEKPAADNSTFIYNGEDQTYNIASNDLYTVSGNVANEIGTHKVTVSLNDTNNYEWQDGTIANLSFDFIIAKDACVNHWILIGILVLGVALVALMLLVVKNGLIGAISSAVLLLGSIVVTIFCGCAICIVFAVVDIVAFAGSSIMFVLKIVSNKAKKETDEDDKPKDKKEKAKK